MTATNATQTFQQLLAMPEFPSVTRPNIKARRMRESLLEATESVVNSLVKSCSVAPIVRWRNLAEPHIGFPEFQQVYTLFREADNLTILSDNDLPLPSYCSRAISAFEHYAELQDDWDGEGAEAPSQTALRDANFFLRIMGSQITEAPEARPMLDQEGVPGIFWSNTEKYLSISFYDQYSLTYHFRDETKHQVSGSTISLDNADGISSLLTLIEEL